MRILSFDIGMKNLTYTTLSIASFDTFHIDAWEIVNLHEYTQEGFHDPYNPQSLKQNSKQWTKPQLSKCLTALGIGHDPRVKKDAFVSLIEQHLKKISKHKRPQESICDVASRIVRVFDAKFSQHLHSYDAILIENQPCMKNPTMKSLQMIIMTYFIVRCHAYDTRVAFASASSKMEYCFQTKLVQEKPKSYKETKKKSIEALTVLLQKNTEMNPDMLRVWNSSRKKDDLSDVVLQALAYYTAQNAKIAKSLKKTKDTNDTNDTNDQKLYEPK